MNTGIWHEVSGLVRSHPIACSVQYLEQGLSNCISPHFKGLIGANFSNGEEDIANYISSFIRECETRFPVRAVYLEMNGFDINTDRWYFDFFGYKSYDGNSEDLDWLADWDSGEWPDTTLTGLESVQDDFEWYTGHGTKGYRDKNAKEAAEFAELLVMCKFACLIEAAVKTNLIQKHTPILATAHGFDIVPRFSA